MRSRSSDPSLESRLPNWSSGRLCFLQRSEKAVARGQEGRTSRGGVEVGAGMRAAITG